MPVVPDLAGLVDLVRGETEPLYVRWSHGPQTDGDATSSRDGLTGVPLPGLSANPLRVEPWWGDRPLRLWLARRLYDYRHLRELRGPGVRPWVLAATECGRGPDNEPLVVGIRPVAWIDDAVLAECEKQIADQQSAEWGPLDRRSGRRPAD
ncbi:DUF6098 family protein [Kutzneria sp. 744]|uniref:DUF6098 family protein n=1 Tax=Kutzneria sp. (strain 744) TaxID=345341 RepID=UPI0005BC9E11|nr:DUF6098 family protein [Kutzneria sp. 744]